MRVKLKKGNDRFIYQGLDEVSVGDIIKIKGNTQKYVCYEVSKHIEGEAKTYIRFTPPCIQDYTDCELTIEKYYIPTQEKEVDITKMSVDDLMNHLRDDGSKWADAFCQFNPDAKVDTGTMTAWFAAAIEGSWDLRKRRHNAQL